MVEMALADLLRRAGHRVTSARLAVLQVLDEAEAGEHLRPMRVLERGQGIYPALSRATVYRTLELLTELGIVRPIYLGDAERYFIRADEGHHHVVCSGCSAVVGFEDCVVDDLRELLSRRLGFEIQGHLLEFYGLCPDCLARQEGPGSGQQLGHSAGHSCRENCYGHR